MDVGLFVYSKIEVMEIFYRTEIIELFYLGGIESCKKDILLSRKLKMGFAIFSSDILREKFKKNKILIIYIL